MRKKIRIQICHNSRSPVVVLLAATLIVLITLGYFASNQRIVSASNQKQHFLRENTASSVPSSEVRRYYLTSSKYNGENADGSDGNGADVCEVGYHFASLWEIFDVSNLKYNTDLGLTKDDSGMGPPSYEPGWLRTGYESDFSSTAGNANCRNWNSNDVNDRGSAVFLPRDWNAGGDLDVWKNYVARCNAEGHVWCVEDYISDKLFQLNVTKSGTGNGTVTSSPAGIDCGADCNEKYIYDTTVNLNALAESGSTFEGWSGDCINAGDCIVTMLSDKNVTATFEATNEVSLPVIMR